MDQMPHERPFREACMSGTAPPPAPWWRRRINIIRGRQETGGRACCWYHGGDWAAVTATAARLIAAAVEADRGADEELRDKVLTAAQTKGLSKWGLIALNTLLSEPITIEAASDNHPASFVNGQHRTRAMRDAGLPCVLVGVIEEIDTQTDTVAS